MPIGTAVQYGSNVFIYDGNGRSTGSINLGFTTGKDRLLGFTSGTVSIQRGAQIFLYDEKGHCVGQVSAGFG